MKSWYMFLLIHANCKIIWSVHKFGLWNPSYWGKCMLYCSMSVIRTRSKLLSPCHNTRIFTITFACSQWLCGNKYLVICNPLLSAFLSNYLVKNRKKKKKKNSQCLKRKKKKNAPTRIWTGEFSITSPESYHGMTRCVITNGIKSNKRFLIH